MGSRLQAQATRAKGDGSEPSERSEDGWRRLGSEGNHAGVGALDRAVPCSRGAHVQERREYLVKGGEDDR